MKKETIKLLRPLIWVLADVHGLNFFAALRQAAPQLITNIG